MVRWLLRGFECGGEWHKTFTVQSHLSRSNVLSAAAKQYLVENV